MSRRNRRRERVYAHVLRLMKVGDVRNSRDMIDIWNAENHDSINPNAFGQIMRGLMALGHVERSQEWIPGRVVKDPYSGFNVKQRGSWETVYRRLK